MSEQNAKKPEATKEKKTRAPRTVRVGYTRVMVSLKDAEFESLKRLADEEEREPGAQLSLLIRKSGILAETHHSTSFGN